MLELDKEKPMKVDGDVIRYMKLKRVSLKEIN